MVNNKYELNLLSLDSNLYKVLDFIKESLIKSGYPKEKLGQIAVASEEIFINIAHYAYGKDNGPVDVIVNTNSDNFEITFIDSGTPFNPLKKDDPDITLSVDEREIGGLGIFMTKMIMDDVKYEYKDNKNIITMIKKVVAV